ncbi:hypothetical protein AB0G02_13915 [Actinosynnema sp. NPDC023658]|uniref:hypothetical protein n=1 Tax=Actinosynnema sp. NPDC023658 TaxID=3155465 RepID=UPI0033E1727E
MLASLLPGLRQFRTPLAAGAVLVVSIVLCIGVGKLTGPGATGLARDAQQLARAAGRPVALAALGFVAFLTGVVWQSVWQFSVRAVCRRLGPRSTREAYATTSRAVFAGLSKRVLAELTDVVATRLRRELSTSGTHAEEFRGALNRLTEGNGDANATERLVRSGAESLTPLAARELLELVPARLITAEKDLWTSWDQARAEAEFRSTLAVPLGALAGTLAIMYHPLWWLGVLIVPVLVQIAGESARRGTGVLLEAVRAQKAPLFDVGTMPPVRWTVRNAAGAAAQEVSASAGQ